jgi:hypothetical protein
LRQAACNAAGASPALDVGNEISAIQDQLNSSV